MNLLDFSTDPDSVPSKAVSLLSMLPQAATGMYGQPPAVNPAIAQILDEESPGALQAAQQNYQRNLNAGFQAGAAHGQSIGGAAALGGQTADQQFSAETSQAVKDAMALRSLRMQNMFMPMLMRSLQGGDDSDPIDTLKAAGAAAAFGFPTQGIQDAAKAQIVPGMAALKQARTLYKKGDTDAAGSFYIQYLKDTGRLSISDRTGALTLLGGTTPEDLKYISVNPQTGAVTTSTGQQRLAGANSVTQQAAAASARGAAAGTVVPVQVNGATQQMPGDQALAALGGQGNPAQAAAPPQQGAPAPVPQRPAPAAPPQQQAPQQQFPLAQTPQMKAALGDASYRYQAPQLPLGRSLTPAQEKEQGDIGIAASELPKEQAEVTQGAATTLTYIKAAQAVLNGGAPTGLSAQVQAGFSRALAAANMTNGSAAQKSQLLVKYLGNLALSNAKATYGPRITQNEVRLQLEELSPSQAMQDGTIGEMLDKLSRISQYAIDSADRARYYMAAHNDPRTFPQWNQHYFPMAEETTPPAAAGAHPPAVEALLKKYGPQG